MGSSYEFSCQTVYGLKTEHFLLRSLYIAEYNMGMDCSIGVEMSLVMPALQLHAEGKAIVQLVLPPSMLTRLNEIALHRGVNRSRVIRDALQQVYFEPKEDSVPESPWAKQLS